MSDIDNRLRAPIRYSPSVERPDADEAETTEGLIATIKYITDKTFADGGHALRGVHAKSHGILEGYLEVDADLPGDLAQGMFAKPGRYPIVMRLSTIPGDMLDDSVSVPRAMAVKIIGVEGERLDGSERDVTQDFVISRYASKKARALVGGQLLAASSDQQGAPGIPRLALQDAAEKFRLGERLALKLRSNGLSAMAQSGHQAVNFVVMHSTAFALNPCLVSSFRCGCIV